MVVLLLIAAAIGVRLRQPLIVVFIGLGIRVGWPVLGCVSANNQVDLLAKLGTALLLFVVGLKLQLHIISPLVSLFIGGSLTATRIVSSCLRGSISNVCRPLRGSLYWV